MNFRRITPAGIIDAEVLPMVLPTGLPTVPRLVALLLASALFLSGAAKKTTATARGENEDLILNVTIYID